MKMYKKQPIKASNKPAPRKRAIKASSSRPADKFYDEIHSKLDDFCSEILRTYYEPFGITEESPAISETVAYDNAINSMTDAVVEYLNVQIEDQVTGEIEESVRAVKATAVGDPYEIIELNKDAYIQDWENNYEGNPGTSWENIWNNVLEDFKAYADDEFSGFLELQFEQGKLSADDMCSEFDDFLQFRDLSIYDE